MATLKDSWNRFDATLKDLDIADWELKALRKGEVQGKKEICCVFDNDVIQPLFIGKLIIKTHTYI
jgi:hypothetical protein